MIEKIILEYLQPHIPTFLEAPREKLPKKFAVVEKTGSQRENMIDSAAIAVQTFAPTLAEVAELNEEIKSLMLDIIQLDTIGSCHLNSDYYFPDTTTKKYRYQAVFDITY